MCLLVLFVLAAVSGQAAAAPAYFGYTGLMLTPTADTVKTAGFDFGAVFLDLDNNDTTFVSANLGLMDSLEIGAALVSPDHGDSEGIINAKYALLNETAAVPGVAIGFSDLTDQIDSTPYIVASKSFQVAGLTWAPRLHVGVGSGKLDGLFFGASAPVNDQLQLMAEYDTDNLNFGLQYAATNTMRLHLGLIDGDNLSLGMSYNVGF